MTPRFSIITTCKGRLENLKRALPGFLNQDDTEIVVVDYDCPDGTADYVTAHYPDIRVVSVSGQPLFNTAHARNLGAAQARGEFLVFLDADVVIADNFMRYVGDRLQERAFALFGAAAGNQLRGSCVVWRRDFEALEGYDELLGGYEGEDLELYARLRLSGARQLVLDPAIVREVIGQTEAERLRFRMPDLKLQFLRGQLYSMAKEMAMKMLGTTTLDPAVRHSLLEQVNRDLPALYHGDREFTLEIRFPDRYRRGLLQEWEFSHSVTLRARRKQPRQD